MTPWPLRERVFCMALYALVALKHKWFVLRAGWWTRAPLWRLLIHDWTKFTPAELPGYARKFCGDAGDEKAWVYAWIHHQNANPHHWQYWMNRGRSVTTVPMPEWAVREMVADWMGSSRAYEGQWPTLARWKWLEKEIQLLQERMHPATFTRALQVTSDTLGVERRRPRWPFWRREGELFPYGLSFQWTRGVLRACWAGEHRRTGAAVRLSWPFAVWLERRTR